MHQAVDQSARAKLVRNDIEKVTLEQAAGRIAATAIVPYPPGIPLLMPGEMRALRRGRY
ncbi:hypothetical protein J7E36_12020 [Pseudomonas fluorescens]|nr:hypothetical protein [Pseudomonas fluorescens]